MSRKTNSNDAAERRRRQVITLFADPANAPKVSDVAKVLNVSRKTIERDLQAVRADMKEAEGKLEQYSRLFAKHLPLEERVRLYEEIARQDGNLFARFKELLRIDAIDGIISDIDRLKVEGRHEQPQKPVPMFSLPPGSRISVTVNQNVQREVQEPEVRNITPAPKAE